MPLRWLLVKFRIQFNSLAPEQISELLMPYTSAGPLRSARSTLKTENTRGQCVCCSGAQTGKQSTPLPAPLGVRSGSSLGCFKPQIKIKIIFPSFSLVIHCILIYSLDVCISAVRLRVECCFSSSLNLVFYSQALKAVNKMTCLSN